MPPLNSAAHISPGIQHLRDFIRQKAAHESAAMIAPQTLRALRGHQGINQADLGEKRVSRDFGVSATQIDISRLEHCRAPIYRRAHGLQLALTNYFHSCGYDADANGATIDIPAVTTPDDVRS